MKKGQMLNILLTGTAFGLLAMSPAHAQTTAPGPAPATAQDPDKLADIIVTAQRREERLQDVPISITAADAETLADQRVFNVQNITSISPSITFRTTALPSSSSNIQIRGIGTAGTARSFEGSVGVFVDGVYRTRSGQALGNFLDIDSLQVLRGPQGTLFGKNTSAGALLLESARPRTDAIGGTFEASYGNYDAYRVMGSINVPLSDTAAFRLAAIQSDHDGYVRNVAGGRLNEQKDRAIKGQLLFEPSDAFTVRLIGDYAKGTGNCCFGTVRTTVGQVTQFVVKPIEASLGRGVSPSEKFDDYQGAIYPDTPTRVEDYGGTLQLDLKLGGGVLKSITALRRYNVRQLQDADYSTADILTVDEAFRSRFFSQELNYTGRVEGGITADYIIGGFYSHETIDIPRRAFWGAQAQPFWNAVFGGLGLPPGFANAAPGQLDAEILSQTADSYAGFAHLDVKVAPQWNIIAGLRYSREIKTGGSQITAVRDPLFDPLSLVGFLPPRSFRARSADSAVSGTFGIQYHPSADAMLYLTYNRGFKAGGVNLDDEATGLPGSTVLAAFFPPTFKNPVYGKETVDAIEGGLKIDWLDGRARTNVSVFYDHLKNLQVAQFLGIQFTIDNVPSAEVYGAELEQTFKLSRELTLTGAATYLPRANYGNSTLLRPPLPGRRFSTAPKFAGQVAINGDFPLNDRLALTGRLQAQYTGTVFTNDADNAASNLTQKGYALVNANLGVTLNDRITVEGWVQNLTDQRYVTQHFNTPLQDGAPGVGGVNAYVGNPRTYGVTLRGQF